MPRTTHASGAIATLFLAGATAGCGSGPSKSDKVAAPPAPPPPKITLFYTSPPVFAAGEAAKLCYSVEDTAKVSLDPPVDRVWPALSRCLEIQPSKTTTYTLTAENAAGVQVAASTEAKVVKASVTQTAVKQPSVQIFFVSAPPAAIPAGQVFQFCVNAKDAKDWKLSAGEWFKPPDATGGCVTDHPAKTTVYTVTAIGANGETDTTRVTATVK